MQKSSVAKYGLAVVLRRQLLPARCRSPGTSSPGPARSRRRPARRAAPPPAGRRCRCARSSTRSARRCRRRWPCRRSGRSACVPFLTVSANIVRSVPPPGNCGAKICWKRYGVAAPCVDAAPRAGVEGRGIDDVRVERVERDVRDPERRPALLAVPDLGERLAAVGRLVDAGLVRAGLEPSRAAVADHVREAANGQRRADEDVVACRVGSITIELMPRPRNASLPGVAHGYVALLDARVVELLPVIAAVGRLVDADAGLAAGRAAVALTGAEVERVVLLVARDRASSVPTEFWSSSSGLDLLPLGIRRVRRCRSARRRRRRLRPRRGSCVRAAVRVGDERRDAAGRDVRRSGEGGHARLDRSLPRPVQLPLADRCRGRRP